MKKAIQRTGLLILPLVALLFAPRALAVSFEIDNGPNDWASYGSGLTLSAGDTLTISANGSPASDFVVTVAGDGVTIVGNATPYTDVRIVVAAGVTDLTLNTLEITAPNNQDPAVNALTVNSSSLALTCTGTVSLTGGSGAVNSGATGDAGIQAAGSLAISGGSLTATGGGGSAPNGTGGIGIQAGGDITATNCDITTTGGGGSALNGAGGSGMQAGGSITIHNGDIIVLGGSGVNNGTDGSGMQAGGSITIHDGNITIDGYNGMLASGSVTVLGGSITAQGKSGGAMGTGYGKGIHADAMAVSGGTVTGAGSPGIQVAGSIRVSGAGEVTGDAAKGIGIQADTIEVSGDGVLAGYGADGQSLAGSGTNGNAGIQAGSLTVSDSGKLTGTGGKGTDNIGTYSGGAGIDGSVTASGGTVVATGGKGNNMGGEGGVGITGNVTNSGGAVTATGGTSGTSNVVGGAGGAGIGGGAVVSGGIVTATGGTGGGGNIGGGAGGAGIGGGAAVSDGTVTATGGNGGDSNGLLGGGAGGAGISLAGAMYLDGGTVAAVGGTGGTGTNVVGADSSAISRNGHSIIFRLSPKAPAVLNLTDKKIVDYTFVKDASLPVCYFLLDGGRKTDVSPWTYTATDTNPHTITLDLLQMPAANPPGGVITAPVSVTLLVPNGDIYYTLDGSDPTNPNGTRQLYTGPITVQPGQILKAVAVKTGWSTSAVMTKVYALLSTDSDYTFEFIRRTLTDKQFGVTVSGDGIADISRLIVQPNKLDPAGTCAACDEIRRRNPLAVYDIILTHGHTGPVDVYIPFSGSGYYTVLHCNKGVLEEQSALYANGGVTTTWRRLSPFAVVRGVNVSVPENTVVDPPKTGDAPTGGMAGVGLVLCALGVLVLTRKKSIRHPER